MTKEEFKKKIDEIENQIGELHAQKKQVKQDFKDYFLRELEVQGITPGTKVLVKTKTWNGSEVETETYFFDICIKWDDNAECIFHKIKKDGTMSQVIHYLVGKVISIHKI